MLFIINLDLRTNCSIVDDDIDIFWDVECICVLRISISGCMKTQFQNKQLKWNQQMPKETKELLR